MTADRNDMAGDVSAVGAVVGDVQSELPRRAQAPGIIVADDDANVRRVLRELLESNGYSVFEAPTGREVMALLDRVATSLITLDLKFDRDDGLDIIRAIRQRHAIPIVVVSAKASSLESIVALELGADDYVVKPFHSRELLARIRAVLRRSDPTRRLDLDAPAETLGFDRFVFDAVARQLRTRDGADVALTQRETYLLEIFLRRPTRVLTRDTLLALLGDDDGEALDRAVDSAIARLRRKLDDAGAAPQLIKTVRGAGYVFSASVQPG